MHFHQGSAGMSRKVVSFLCDGRGHGGPYGRPRRGRQLLDLRVQPPDDPLHGFATLDQGRKNVSPSKVPIRATVGPLTAKGSLLFLIFFSSKRL